MTTATLMSPSPGGESCPGAAPRGAGLTLLLGFIIVAATVGAYATSLNGPFIFDDNPAILANEYIRQLWPIPANLWAPYRSTLSGRPLLGLSFALNYAAGGLNVVGYHATNISIHVLAALLLFGIIRRTLSGPHLAGRYAAAALPIAFAAALLWAVHPLQTQSVTYIVQRAESLTGLFYLATLYAFIRGAASGAARWFGASIVACLAGMATKEVMVTAPVVVLLYDTLFMESSPARAIRRRPIYYAGLFATWVLLFALMLSWPRASSAGFAVKDLSPLSYLINQPAVILHYLWLAVWPRGLCIDYGWKAEPLSAVALPILLVASLLATTIWAILRRPVAGFALAVFFILLAPTSSIVPIRDIAFEHRMYLPLAAVCAVAVALLALALGMAGRSHRTGPARLTAFMAIVLVAAFVLAVTTVRRNEQYASALSIWSDVVAKHPANHRGYVGIGIQYASRRDITKALEYFQKALQLYPDSRHAHFCMAATLMDAGRPDDALPHARRAVELEPDLFEDRNLLGVLLNARREHDEAARQFEEAIRLKPDSGPAHLGLARAQARLRRFDEAAGHYQQAILLGFQADVARIELGDLLLQVKLFDQAARVYQEALHLSPGQPVVMNRLGYALLRMNQHEAAAEVLKDALRLDASLAPAHFNYGDALSRLNRLDEALAEYEQAHRLKPNLPKVGERIAETRAKITGSAPQPTSRAYRAGHQSP